MNTLPLDVLVHLVVNQSDDLPDVLDALRRMRVACRAEPGCLAWQAVQSSDDPLQIVLIEQWASRNDFDAHGELGAIQHIYLPEVLPKVRRIVTLGHALI